MEFLAGEPLPGLRCQPDCLNLGDAAAFQTAVNALTATGGGDTPEAQLSGIMSALNGLTWLDGATKAVVVITDATGKDPEPVTGFTRASANQRALEIDPVAIYGVNVSTLQSVADWMAPLATGTAGDVVTLAPGQSLSDALSNLFESAHANPVAKLSGPYVAQTGTAINFSAADSFDASATITSYKWDFDGNGTVDRTTATPTTSFTYAGEFHGIASVEVVADDGRSALATTQVTVDSVGLANLQPIAVTSATATVTGASQVTVTWTPAANDRADGYKVYRANGTPIRFTTAADPDSAVLDGISLSQPVQFYVRAVNGYGESASAATAPVGGNPPGWQPSQVVDSQATGSSAEISLGPDGRGYAVWQSGGIQFARWDPVTGWGARVRVNPATANSKVAPTIGVDSGNNAYATWTDYVNGTSNPDIYFSKRPSSTGTWGTAVKVSADTGTAEQRDAQIAVLANGSAIAVWVDRRSSQWNIYSSRLAAGASVWGTNVRATSNTSNTVEKSTPRVVLGSDGTAYAVWSDARNGNLDIWYATLAPSASAWSTNVKVSDDTGSAAQTKPSIGMDSTGNLTVAWLDARVSTGQVRVASRPAATGIWSASALVSDSAARPLSLDMAVRSDGRAAIGWEDVRSINDLWGTEKPSPSQGWQAPTLWSDTTVGKMDGRPALAIDGQRLAVIWDAPNKLVIGAAPGNVHARFKQL